MATHIDFEGRALSCRTDETLLDAQLRQGEDVPFSCKRGICHVCLQHCEEGPIPAEAQAGLRPTLAQDGYFLPCVCRPQAAMRVARPDPAQLFQTAIVVEHQRLADDVCLVRLGPVKQIDYQPGQFIQLRRADGLTRSYALAGLPDDYLLEIHVRRHPAGALSPWITDELAIGNEVEVAGPMGEPLIDSLDDDTRPWLMLAQSTGLAPLAGLLRAALSQSPERAITLFHEAADEDGHYLHESLSALASQYANFSYVPRVSAPSDAATLSAHALPDADAVRDKAVIVAGPEDFVAAVRAHARALGVPEAHVHAAPFLFRDLRRKLRPDTAASADTAPEPDTPRTDPTPDPSLWAALGEGERLHTILADFYTRVFADPQLSPFFHATSRQRAIEKQYLFLRQLFSGEKVYFGDRPRNAHHWMVISDELFNYRARLLAQCMREHGLDEAMIGRWLDMEEHFRDQIVKDAPIPRIMNGVALPLGGFDETTLDVGSLCDSCQREIAVGETVRYHRRTGNTYCNECMGKLAETAPDGR